MQFIILGLILYEFIEFVIHRIFTCDIGFDCLYMLEYLFLVITVVMVEVVIVGSDVRFEDIEDSISDVFALGVLGDLVDQVG